MANYILPKTRENVPQILVTGNVVADLSFTFLKHALPGPDAKGKSDNYNFSLGGGGGNFITVYHLLNEEYNIATKTKLYTGIGQDDGTLETIVPRMVVIERLEAYGIETVDVRKGVNAVPMAAVAEHNEGRSIWGSPAKQATELAPNILNEIENATKRASFTFIDPRMPLIGAYAAEGARNNSGLSMTDYGDKAWPSDNQDLADLYDRILGSVDITVVPSDAVIEGMKGKNPETLIHGLYERYLTSYILMTDAGNDAIALIHGKKHVIPVENYQGEKFSLAAGDSRNACFAFCLTLMDNAGELTLENKDAAILKAFKMATAMATLKIQYSARSFVHHLDDLFQNNPLFSDYKDQLVKDTPANDTAHSAAHFRDIPTELGPG